MPLLLRRGKRRCGRVRNWWTPILLCSCGLAATTILWLKDDRTTGHGQTILSSVLQLEFYSIPPIPNAVFNTKPINQSDKINGNIYSSLEIQEDILRRYVFLPYKYWYKHRNDQKKFYRKKDCAPFPSILDLEFNNLYWQTLWSSSGVFHFYGAYMDNREASEIGPAVRILAVHDRINVTLATHCQLWFEKQRAPVIVPVSRYTYIWYRKWGNFKNNILQPYLMTCVLPKDVKHLVPASVSVVEGVCDRATNHLRVYYERPKPPETRKSFIVCVKGLNFLHQDISERLVEWIEIIRQLGAQRIVFYELQVHPNIIKVLSHYIKMGVVESIPLTFPGGRPNLPGLQQMYLQKKISHKRQMEVIPYNDCLYRNLYKYRWLVLLDIDEVLVPMRDMDWSSLMMRILPLSKTKNKNKVRSGYYASNLLYLETFQKMHGLEPTIPEYMYMMQRVYRTQNFTPSGHNIKGFHETDRVLTLHNHFPFHCLGSCSHYPINNSDARLQHYRNQCTGFKGCSDANSSDPVRDEHLWRWKDFVVPKVEDTLRSLGFLATKR